jgi:hypothetical protein
MAQLAVFFTTVVLPRWNQWKSRRRHAAEFATDLGAAVFRDTLDHQRRVARDLECRF